MIIDHLLPYAELLDLRPLDAITLVVIHCTELPDLATTREYGLKVLYASGTGNCGHYTIDRDGRTERYVPDQRVANHTRGYNPRSIGIELVNIGRYPDWLHSQHQQMTEPYPDAQIAALLDLLAQLRARCPQLGDIAGHEDLDLTEVPASDDPAVLVRRKRDPGPMFPWRRVVDACGLRRRLSAQLP